LFLDGHDSHETPGIKSAVYQFYDRCKIILIALPSKTTHKLQPLDVGIFNHVQTAWEKNCDELLGLNERIDRYNVIDEYMKVHNKVMKPELIQSAFKNAGLHPLNPDIFTEEDFAPSDVTARLGLNAAAKARL
jgi:hypothetical protein